MKDNQLTAIQVKEIAVVVDRAHKNSPLGVCREDFINPLCETALAAIAERDALKARIDAHNGHKKPCYYCGEPCNNFAANPGEWSIPMCHSDEPGRVKWHHGQCVQDRLIERDRLRAAIEAAAHATGCSTRRPHHLPGFTHYETDGDDMCPAYHYGTDKCDCFKSAVKQ